MNWHDIKPGTEVYHSLIVSRGKGIVEAVVGLDLLEAVFEHRGGNKRIIVNWTDGARTRSSLRSLRKSPNRKRIRELVAYYETRGTVAEDGGDRLIFPR